MSPFNSRFTPHATNRAKGHAVVPVAIPITILVAFKLNFMVFCINQADEIGLVAIRAERNDRLCSGSRYFTNADLSQKNVYGSGGLMRASQSDCCRAFISRSVVSSARIAAVQAA